MTSQAADAAWRPAPVEGWRLDLLASLCATFVMVAVQAVQGFPLLTDAAGDTDSLMRLVQIRDLLAGQGWFDLHQYRMGVEGGFLIHWSRIVDTPVATIIWLVSSLTGNVAFGETVASVVWPAVLFAGVLFFLVRIARRLAGPDAFLPALIVGAITLNLTGMFGARALDHHNLQLLLSLAVLDLLLDRGWRSSALAGLCCALMLAVGMETLPYVVVAGSCVALSFLLNGRSAAVSGVGFGLGFAVSALAALLATVPVESWWTPQCDAYSAGLGLVAVGAGLGLAAAIALSTGRGMAARVTALGILALATGFAALVLAPQCFSEPYSSLDPMLKTLWIDRITEAQSLSSMIRSGSENILRSYATPFLAAGLMAVTMLRRPLRREEWIVAAFLLSAILVSVWQVRGTNFSIPFAVAPLGAWVAQARRNAQTNAPGGAVKMVLAWLLSLNLVWGAVEHGFRDAFAANARPGNAAGVQDKGGVDSACYADATFADLARLPPASVLTISNLGASVLAFTPHRSLSGPSHRNADGNLKALQALTADPARSRSIVRDQKIGLIVVCPGNDETRFLSEQAPNGLLAHLFAGDPPAWLEPVVSSSGKPLVFYSVKQN